MKIAFCPPEWNPLQQAARGEPSNATYLIQINVSLRLKARGHALTFIAQRDPGNNVCTDSLEDPRPAPLTWSGYRMFEIAQRAAWRIQKIAGVPYLNVFSNLRLYDACLRCLPGHEVAYERNGLYRTGVARACRRLGIPHVLYVEADEILELDYTGAPITGILRRRARRMFQYNLSAASRIVCVSESLRRHLVDGYKIPPEKILVLPNCVDATKFRPDPPAASRIRASLNIENQPLALFVGGFYPWHDVGTLLHAFAAVLKSCRDARLILVGDGAARHEMEKYALELGIGDSVSFVGSIPHDKVADYMAAADVAVVPYPVMRHEMWFSPLKLFEYMAAGKAIVASAVGQVTDVIEDGRNGLLTPPADVAAVAGALKKLIHDPGLRARLGLQAREDALRKHSWDRYISRLEEAFNAAIKGERMA
ncbi:MAG: glycosyltransferase family 4 protein [Acidobacteria bacterium]|nr:glycosyltransferase family 4 protein [Acidobacteriota bacterium]